jgi:predicted PurR-regulated permease PerM
MTSGNKKGDVGMLSWSRQRRSRVILVSALLLLVYVVVRAAHTALIPYVLALVLAYLLLPAVKWLENNMRRFLRLGNAAGWLAILIVYLFTIGLVAWFFSIVVPLVIQQFQTLWDNRDFLSGRMQDLTIKVWTWYRHSVSEQIQTQVDASLQRIGASVMTTAQDALARTFTVLTTTVGWILSLTIIPFWLFYVLYDRDKLTRALHGMLPEGYRPDFVNLVQLTDNVLGAYLRGQIVLGVAAGVMVFAGLAYLRVQFALLLAVLAALFQFIPIIGPILGAIPAVIVASIQSPVLGLWTAIFFLVIQQIEGSILGPRIAGNSVKLNPAIMLIVLVVGNEMAGLWGMLIAVPLTAIIRDVFRYLYMRFQEEPVPPQEALKRLLEVNLEHPRTASRRLPVYVGTLLQRGLKALAGASRRAVSMGSPAEEPGADNPGAQMAAPQAPMVQIAAAPAAATPSDKRD